MKNFLRTRKTQIVTNDGRPITLKGVNLGGWLMMEAYILYAPNVPEQKFKKDFKTALGPGALTDFEDAFRGHFIQREDIQEIAQMGLNCARVPFHYRVVESAAYRYDAPGLRFLDRVIRWAKDAGVRVILDLHAAPGAQNHDWHSDSSGQARLWTQKSNRDRALSLWEFLADRYRNEDAVAGYDLLNEAVVSDAALLNQFYKDLIRRIRRVDPNHILFVEGNRWATDISCLDEYPDGNYALSIHRYDPLDFTFNFVPGQVYPGGGWDRSVIRKNLEGYKAIADRQGVPVFVGEFGVNVRDGHYGEGLWLKDMMDALRACGFHWTYWTYKAVKNGVFPDGLFSYVDNPPWVNRLGPRTGWETFQRHWTDRKKEMARSWRTEQFRPNAYLIEVLKHAAR